MNTPDRMYFCGMAVNGLLNKSLAYMSNRYAALARIQDELKVSSAHGLTKHEDRIETIPPRPEESSSQQAVDCYITEESEDDYTFGPAKMISIQDALMGDRVLQELGFQIEQQRNEIHAREQDLRFEILRSDRKVDRLELRITRSGGQLTKEQQEEMEQHKAAVVEGEKQRMELEEEETKLRERWEAAQLRQQMLQGEVNAILQDVFIRSLLLPPVEGLNNPKMDDFEGFNGMRQNCGSDQDVSFNNPAQTEPQAHSATTPHKAAIMQASRDLEHARGDVQRAQRDFDIHQYGYDHSLQNYLSTQVNRPVAEVKTEHDVLYLQQGQNITRKLLAAEAALDVAKSAAKTAGLPIQYYQESNFGDCPDDGYRESQDAIVAASVDRKWIDSWLASAKTEMTIRGGTRRASVPATEPELDEWDVDDDRPFDSVSLLAEGSSRKKIDQWRRVTEQ